MIFDHELDEWLGPVSLPPEQRAEFGRLVREYDATQHETDREYVDCSEQDEAAWIAAYEQATTKPPRLP